jgi:hypothetical protein
MERKAGEPSEEPDVCERIERIAEEMGGVSV